MTDPVKTKDADGNEVVVVETPAADTIKTNYSGAQAMAGVLKLMSGMKHSDQIEFFNKSLEKYSPGTDNQAKNLASIKSSAKVKMPMPTMKEDLDVLFEGQELSEEAKEKLTALFDAAVNAGLEIHVAGLNEEFDAELEKAYVELEEGLKDSIDEYLSEAVDNWLEENKIALETNTRHKQLEAFVEKIQEAFSTTYIEIPEDKVDLVKGLEESVADLTKKLNDETNARMALEKTISEQKRGELVATVSEGLTDVDAERFASLIEAFDYSDPVVFEKKIRIVRESYFKAPNAPKKDVKPVPGIDVLSEENTTDNAVLPPAMQRYLAHIDRTVKSS